MSTQHQLDTYFASKTDEQLLALGEQVRSDLHASEQCNVDNYSELEEYMNCCAAAIVLSEAMQRRGLKLDLRPKEKTL